MNLGISSHAGLEMLGWAVVGLALFVHRKSHRGGEGQTDRDPALACPCTEEQGPDAGCPRCGGTGWTGS